jgi:hypothetical protein
MDPGGLVRQPYAESTISPSQGRRIWALELWYSNMDEGKEGEAETRNIHVLVPVVHCI